MPRYMKPKMPSKLKGKQKELDLNKNNRLDTEDFAMLRIKKKGKKSRTAKAMGLA